METTPIKAQEGTEKKFNYPLSTAVKNALTGATIEGYHPEKNNIEVRLANASYLKLQVADKTGEYLKNNPDMPKLQIKDVKNHSLELGKTFIELTPDAVKFLNTKFMEKSVSIPEKLKINKEEITLSAEQRKDLGSGKPVNIGTIGKGKEEVYLMLNPSDDKKIMVLNAKSVAEPVQKVQAQGQPEKAEAPAAGQAQKVKKAATAKSPGL
jgi:hypothetical protein